jgi:hypothetical protein
MALGAGRVRQQEDVAMRIVEAEPQLVRDIIDEMEVAESQDRGAYVVYVGYHKTLGRIVVISGPGEHGTIVEMT